MSGTNNKCDCMIINFWSAINYGALLTCFGVYCLAQKLGKSAKVINYVGYPKDVKCEDFKKSFASRFAEKYMNLTSEINDYNDLYNLNNDCDTFIAGSDQIWRRTCANNVLNDKLNWTVFFLDFVRSNKKKISYAASIGMDELIDAPLNIEKMNFYLSQFDSISVREERYKELIKEHFNLDATCLLDGAFHIPNELLNEMTEEYKSNEKYIACFALPYFANAKWYKDIVQNISKKLNLPIKVFEWDYTTPVEKWLGFIKNAQFVITDSYHCVVFSLIFNVPFLQVQNAKTQNRFDCLFSLLNLKNRSVKETDTNIPYEEIISPIDWQSVNSIIEQEKIKAQDWLKNAFDKETKEKPLYPNFLDDKNMNPNLVRSFNNSLCLILNRNKIKRKYFKYRIMANLSFGKKREYYKNKKYDYKKKINELNKLTEIIKQKQFFN